jgi:hypothetical protein
MDNTLANITTDKNEKTKKGNVSSIYTLNHLPLKKNFNLLA